MGHSTKTYNRAWYEQNKERINAERRAISGERLERKRARNRAWYANMTPEQRRGYRVYMRFYSLRRRFKLTLVGWLSLFHLQGCRCACCGATESSPQWHTDHDHDTGTVRGILCGNCNMLIGRLGDNSYEIRCTTERLLSYIEGAEECRDANGRLIPWEPS